MTIARSILALNFFKVLLVVVLCVCVELLACVFGVGPRLERRLIHWADKYDAYFPEITVQDGQASIRERQPYYIENVGDNGLVLVIDTTISSYDATIKYLEKATYGAVLTRSAIVNKEGGQIKVVSLKEIPDMVINSENIRKAIDELGPIVKTWGVVFLSVFFVVTKLLQVAVLAAIPYFGVQLFRGSITFEEAFRLAAVCMVVPVGINFFLSFSAMSIVQMLMVYYVTFVATLIIAIRDYGADRQPL